MWYYMYYPCSHNHGSGKWLYLKGNYCLGIHPCFTKKNITMVRRAYNSKLRCIFQSENRFWWETARWNTSLQVEKMRWYSKLCSGYFINTSPGSSLVENRWWFFLVPVSWRFFLSVQLGWKQKYRMLRLTHVVTHERLVGYFSKNTWGKPCI